jgi:hypothetical protein
MLIAALQSKPDASMVGGLQPPAASSLPPARTPLAYGMHEYLQKANSKRPTDVRLLGRCWSWKRNWRSLMHSKLEQLDAFQAAAP